MYIEVIPHHKKYSISSEIWSNQALLVKHGKAEKAFTMDIISNQPVTQVNELEKKYVSVCVFWINFAYWNDIDIN